MISVHGDDALSFGCWAAIMLRSFSAGSRSVLVVGNPGGDVVDQRHQLRMRSSARLRPARRCDRPWMTAAAGMSACACARRASSVRSRVRRAGHRPDDRRAYRYRRHRRRASGADRGWPDRCCGQPARLASACARRRASYRPALQPLGRRCAAAGSWRPAWRRGCRQ